MTSGHSHDDRNARTDDSLAQAARSAHAASLDNLSPRVRAQLAQRRRAALADRARPAAARRWPMVALGSAAALTLAVGLFLSRDTEAPPLGEIAVAPTGVAPAPAPRTPDTAPAPVVAGTETHTNTHPNAPQPAVETILIDDTLPADLLAAEFAGADAALGFDALQESPDFYLWLGSDSAQADISELL